MASGNNILINILDKWSDMNTAAHINLSSTVTVAFSVLRAMRDEFFKSIDDYASGLQCTLRFEYVARAHQ